MGRSSLKTVLTWILLILLAIGGIGGTVALSEAFRSDAREAWEAQASKVAHWLSATVLGWLEESYAPLSGLAILFENSRVVTEVEFLGATDALEARASSFFIDAKVSARPQANGKSWSVEFSNDPLGPLSPGIDLSQHPVISQTIAVAVDNPDRVMLGPPFSFEDDQRYSPAVLAIQDANGPLVIIGLVNFDAIVEGLFDIHNLEGLQIEISGRFQTPDGLGDPHDVIRKSVPDALYSVTTRTASAGVDLSITWYMDQRFSQGPQETLANLTLLGGIGSTILFVTLIGLLLQRNRTINQKVEDGTRELTESRQRLAMALTASKIGTWDWDIETDALFWDEAQHEIMGTDPAEADFNLAGFVKSIHPDDLPRVQSEIKAALASRKDYISEHRFLRPNGEIRTLEARGHVLRDDDGRPVRMIGTNMDITERKQAEDELKKLSQAVEQSPVSVVITDLNGTIEYVNPKFCQVTGYSYEEAIGQNPRILKSEQNPSEVYEELWETIKAGDEWRGELLNKKKDGELYWEAVSISGIKSIDGAIAYYLAVKEDITARKEMEDSIREKEARFRNYFEHSQVGMAITSPVKGWVAANNQLQRMLGYSLDEMRQMTWAELTHPDDLKSDLQHFERMLAGEIDSYTLEKRFMRKDEQMVYVNLSVACMRDESGDVIDVLASFQDITERKGMEDNLQLQVTELDEAQSAMLNMMEDLSEERIKAEAATQAKSDFLANMSHEIRTPMNAIIGMAHLALKTELTPKQQDYLNKIQFSANSLLGIINDILDFSKIEAGKLDMEAVEFDLAETLDNVANVITVKAHEKEDLEVLFKLDPEVPSFLVGDSLRLNQILVNLGNNAVKFTEQGEIVLITKVLKSTKDKVTLQFSMRDTGIGMTKEQQAKLFQAFSQADTSTTRKYGGTGLGLTISKRLVNLMGGEIWAESEPGQGTTFSFTAAFGLGKARLKKRFEPSPDLRGLKVLVVDDNITSRRILQEMLESFSFEVSVAASGAEGVSELENASEDAQFELVLMDWKMPDMDGIEASRRIKQHKGLHKIPAIILVTAYGREQIMQQAEQAGLEGFLLKPVSPSTLFDVIMQAIDRDASVPKRIQRPAVSQEEAMKHIQGARILLVEDNEINQQVAKEILQGAGLYVTVANDGQEGVNAVKQNQYDVILMDIQMPVMDGLTATREIRAWEKSKIQDPNSKFESVPILAMTAHAMAGDEQKSLDAGMDGHVTKPIDPDKLFAALQKWIKPATERHIGSQQPIQDVPTEPDQAKRDEEEFPESLPGFDLADGLKRLQGNKKLYLKLLSNFAADYRSVADDIRQSLDADDFEQAHSVVHNIKGMAGNLAATELQTAAMSLEKLVKGRTPKEVSDKELNQKFSALKNALDQALDAVQTIGPGAEVITAEAAAGGAATVQLELPKEITERILAAADMGDVTQIKSIAEELISESDAMKPFGEKLGRLAEDFDFDGIQTLMDAH